MASERVQIPIDKFGRVVLPKEIRDRLGVRPGTEFEVEEQENIILLKPVGKKSRIVEKDGWWVIETDGPIPEDAILKAIEQDREDRDKAIWGSS